MQQWQESEDYDPNEWGKFSPIYMSYFMYSVALSACEKVVETNEAKELLEIIKNVEFDVIIQDVTLHQCLYGLWQVRINNLLKCMHMY